LPGSPQPRLSRSSRVKGAFNLASADRNGSRKPSRSPRSESTSSANPCRRHPLAAVKASILFRGPSLLVAPGRLECGARRLERRCGAVAVFTWFTAGIEAERPIPAFRRVRVAGGAADHADANVAKVDAPGVGAVGVEAAGELGHGRGLRRGLSVGLCFAL
jgi:hypothetical protein